MLRAGVVRPDKDGFTPLQHAKIKGCDEMVRILSVAS